MQAQNCGGRKKSKIFYPSIELTYKKFRPVLRYAGQQVIHILMNADDFNRQAAPAQNSDEARQIAQAGAADATQNLYFTNRAR